MSLFYETGEIYYFIKNVFIKKMGYASKLDELTGNIIVSFKRISRVYQGYIYEILNIKMTT